MAGFFFEQRTNKDNKPVAERSAAPAQGIAAGHGQRIIFVIALRTSLRSVADDLL